MIGKESRTVMATETKRDYVILVSGLPRSGTSMMMKMLEAGGLNVVVDNLRTADTDNPEGYYEFEPIKKVKQDSSWMPTAVGKVVKAIYKLLYDLPPNYQYRVIFMRRKLDEVLASQTKMLDRRGQKSPVEDEKIKQIFTAELDRVYGWLAKSSNFSVQYIDYNEMLADPAAQVAALNAFLGGGLNTEAMMQVVNPSLYRNRAKA